MAIRVRFTKILALYNAQRADRGEHPLSMSAFADEAGIDYQKLRRWAQNRIDSSSHDILSGVMRRLDGIELHDEVTSLPYRVTFDDLFEYIPDSSDA